MNGKTVDISCSGDAPVVSYARAKTAKQPKKSKTTQTIKTPARKALAAIGRQVGSYRADLKVRSRRPGGSEEQGGVGWGELVLRQGWLLEAASCAAPSRPGPRGLAPPAPVGPTQPAQDGNTSMHPGCERGAGLGSDRARNGVGSGQREGKGRTGADVPRGAHAPRLCPGAGRGSEWGRGWGGQRAV